MRLRSSVRGAAAGLLALTLTAGGLTGGIPFASAAYTTETVYAAEQSEGTAAAGNPQTVGETDLSDGFVYAQLSPSAQKVYAEIYQEIRDHRTEFTVHSSDTEDIKQAISAVLADCPQFFWVDGTASMSGFRALGTWTITMNYIVSPDEIDGIQARIEEKVQEYLKQIPEGASEYEKVRLAYEYVIGITDYSLASEHNQNIMSVFLNGSSVCAGYARAFKYLLDRAGVWCGYIEGTISDTGEGHAWNVVRIDGIYSYVDPSWGDPSYGEDHTDAKQLSIIYDYLCLTEEEMLRARHQPDAGLQLPSTTDRSNDFYIRNGMYYEGYSESSLSSALWNAVDNAIDIVYLKYSDYDSYTQAKNALFPDNDDVTSLLDAPIRQRMEWDNASSMRYYYSCSDELWIIKIYW
ncbi:MAG: transglutaminase domain-containing protein [Lachnospiraceae bacterium]|nr:transglutaminase domain-containing protein [Lachnospiraceae bacterium]